MYGGSLLSHALQPNDDDDDDDDNEGDDDDENIRVRNGPLILKIEVL